jgi:DHA2 family methylenomycin A resistance protein-like MFS transporter
VSDRGDQPTLVVEGELESGSWWPPPRRGRAGGPRVGDRWWVLFVVCAGLFASGLTVTALTTAVPFIRRDLGTSLAAITWVVSAPFLFRSIFVPAFGKAADRVGRRRIWIVGFTVSTVASLACGFAPNVGLLIVFRALAAIGSAAVVPSSLALIAVAFAPDERVKAFGWWSACAALSPVVGVVIGGLVVEAFGWRWLFYGQFPFSVVALLLGAVVLHESHGERAPFDVSGTILSILGLGSMILVLNRGPVGEWSWGSPTLVLAGVFSVACIVLFVVVEHRAVSPIVPVDLFRRRPFAAGVAANFLGNFAYMGGFFITSLMLAEPKLFGYDAGEVALAVAPRAAALGIFGPIGGYLAARYGGRRMATLGMTLVGISMLMLASLDAGAVYTFILPGLVISGIGLGLVGPPSVAAVTNEAASEDLGAAGAAVNFGASFGSSMGIAAMQAVLVATAASASATGMSAYSAAFLAGAIATAFGVVATLNLTVAGSPRTVRGTEAELARVRR